MRTTVRGMNQSINYFFRKLGLTDVHARYMPFDFSYVITSDERIVCYNFEADKELMDGLKKYLNTLYPNRPKCTDFTFGLLHELGHHLTIDKFDNNVYNKDKESKKEITRQITEGKITKTTAQIKYCDLPLEKIATKKAIELLINNYEEIQNFEKRFTKLMQYYVFFYP